MKEISIEEIQKAINECYETHNKHAKACTKVAKMIPQVDDGEDNYVFMQSGDGLVIAFGTEAYNTTITAELIVQLRKAKSRKCRFALLVENSI